MNEILLRVDDDGASTPANGTGSVANGKDHSISAAAVNDIDAVALVAIRPELVSAAAQHGQDAADALQTAMLADEVAYLPLRDAAAKALGLPGKVIEEIRHKFRDARKKAERKSAEVVRKNGEAAAADAAILPVEQRHFLDLDDAERKQEAARTEPLCKDLAHEPDILAKADELLTARGVVGETQIKRAVILAVGVARLFDKPVSLVLKGISSSGKSYTARSALQLLPPLAVLTLTDMSDRALTFLPPGTLRNRVIYLQEATPTQQDPHSPKAHSLRILMSENRLEYLISEKDPKTGKWVARKIVQEGPTACIVTTTEGNLHHENETRVLSLKTDETPQQTAAIKLAIAKRRNGVLSTLSANSATGAEDAEWHALFRHIEVGGPYIVNIPFLDWVTLNSGCHSIRTRRDMDQLVSLIVSSAILHQATRSRLPSGEIIATPQDYANAVAIIATGADQAAGRAVSKQVADVHQVVYDLVKAKVERDELPALGYQPGDDAKAAARTAARLNEAMMKARVPLSEGELAKRTARSPSAARRDLADAVTAGAIVQDVVHQGRTGCCGLGTLHLPRGNRGIFPRVEDVIAAGQKGWDAAVLEAEWQREFAGPTVQGNDDCPEPY